MTSSAPVGRIWNRARTCASLVEPAAAVDVGTVVVLNMMLASPALPAIGAEPFASCIPAERPQTKANERKCAYHRSIRSQRQRGALEDGKRFVAGRRCVERAAKR
jgi:hypothetical protein